MSGADFVRFCVRFYFTMGAVAAALALAFGQGDLFRPPASAAALVTGLAAALLAAAAAALLSCCLLKTRSGLRLAADFLSMLPTLDHRQIALAAVASGLGEELLFRGFLLPVTGLAASSLLFGLMHFPVRRSLRVWTMFALAAGFAFGLLAVGTGSVLYPALAHAITNVAGFTRLMRLREGRDGRYADRRRACPGPDNAV